MKRVVLLLLAIVMMPPVIFAGDKGKSADNEIQWLTWDEVQVKMKENPKKVWVDIYTDWCGWCKVMDKKVFSNPDVIKYMNEHFYAVKFNAERPEDIRFMGKMFPFNKQQKVSSLAVELMQGRMSYPTSVFMEENFQGPSPIPGYQPVTTMEVILTFLAEGHYKDQDFETYNSNFKHTWTEGS